MTSPIARTSGRVRPGIRALNWLCVPLVNFGVGSLSEASILQASRRNTGLRDLGDERFRVPLSLILKSYQQDDELTFLGRMIARGMVAHLVANRMRIHAEISRHPAILEEVIQRPLFIVGLPRTGTTLLYNLLCQDSSSRPLMFWESHNPATPRKANGKDPRVRDAQKMVDRLNRALPQLKAIHEFNAEGPDECTGLLLNTFTTPYFRGRLPDYREWLFGLPDQEIQASYQEYERQLQLLQRQKAGQRWLLKSPSHLFGLSSLLRQFPSAQIVYTQRDIAQSIPSLCSLTLALDSLSYKTTDRQEIGCRTLGIVRRLVQGGVQGRRSEGSNRIFTIPYDDLVSDPVATVRAIYDRFGLQYGSEFESRLRAYLAKNPKHKHGAHQYSLKDFGLTATDMSGLDE